MIINQIIMQKIIQNIILVSFVILIIPASCGQTEREKESGPDPVASHRPSVLPEPRSGSIVTPGDGDTFILGEEITIDLQFDETSGEVEEVNMTVDGVDTMFSGSLPGTLVWNSAGQPVGSRHLRIIIDFEDGPKETYSLRVILKSDITPRRYTYRAVNSYPHDIRAFTQGLVYHQGYLYESTGRYGRSTLRKVDLETGDVLRSLNLDRDLFGEGLCVHDDKLYQLTWQSQVGFIYDIESFSRLGRVYYETEGWGLTSDGTNLLKSDGSHYIYVLDPRYFAEVDRIEVYDHNGRVENINELEFIDGIIYANVFDTDNIIMIERETGRVTGLADLTGLLDQRYHHPDLDVLNGIAYDHENDRLFVTGKNWPRLFEIDLIPE